MRRYDYHVPEDSPEIVIAERVESIATDLERIADALEGEHAETADSPILHSRDPVERLADQLAEVLEETDSGRESDAEGSR